MGTESITAAAIFLYVIDNPSLREDERGERLFQEAKRRVRKDPKLLEIVLSEPEDYSFITTPEGKIKRVDLI